MTKLPVIVIVEDDVDIATSIDALIDPDIYEVHLAFSGREGIRLIEMLHPCVLILDIILYDISGWDIIDFVRMHKSSTIATIPVLIVSAFSEIHLKAKAAKYNTHYIKKPFNFIELEKAIHKVCPRKPDDKSA